MKFPLARYNQFCSELVIDSKERGQIKLVPQNKWSTQKEFIKQIVMGLEEDIHFFVCLKGRQEGVTTECAALDLFWMYQFSGSQGTFIAHEESARDLFRSMLVMYHSGLPKSHRKRMLANNRHFISWANRSRMAMMINGSAKGKSSEGQGGRGIGRGFVHGTECSSYGDQKSFDSMVSSLAQSNPNRLYVFESTARGYELFHEMWTEAGMATSRKRFFVGWWLQDLYRKERDSREFAVYGREDPSPTEREWMRAVRTLYDYTIQPEQLAWWRWMMAEEITDENSMLESYPPTEDHAFIMSGSNFFPIDELKKISDRIRLEPTPSFWRFDYQEEFWQTTMSETSGSRAELTIFEEPDLKWGVYSIGADPAFGSSDWADQFSVQVFRSYQDRFEQVAEYATTDITTDKFAWVLCYLSGLYRNSTINLEFQGGGEAVQAEMNRLRRRASSIPPGPEKAALDDVRGQMRYHLFRRLDSVSGGGGAYHTVTTRSRKEGYMSMFRDLVKKGRCVIHSTDLIEEMKKFVRTDDGGIEASGRGKDDRVIAAGLATLEYRVRQESALMHMQGFDWQSEQLRRNQAKIDKGDMTPVNATIDRMVGQYLTQAGLRGVQKV